MHVAADQVDAAVRGFKHAGAKDVVVCQVVEGFFEVYPLQPWTEEDFDAAEQNARYRAFADGWGDE
jgi:hypothetical protein